MTIKEQWNKIKENWLLALGILVLVLISLFTSTFSVGILSGRGDFYGGIQEMALAKTTSYGMGRSYYPIADEGFAPKVAERKITKTASLSTEVERGEFQDAEATLKSIVSSSGSFLLNENVYRSGTGRRAYYSGNYQLKVETGKYDVVVAQLKEIGEVQSFSESADDVTGRYTNLKVELEAEKSRLARYESMYLKAANVGDQITLSDRIFDQERTIKYLEDALDQLDKRVDYSTLSVQISEKQSEYTNVVLIKFSDLIRNLVSSFNGLLSLIFVALPYAVAALVVWLGVRFLRKKKR